MATTERRHNFFGNSIEEAPFLLAFIGYLKEEAPFYWVNLGGGWWTCSVHVQYAGGGLGVSFYGPCPPWRAGHLVVLLVEPM